jgi:hypothetical protein
MRQDVRARRGPEFDQLKVIGSGAPAGSAAAHFRFPINVARQAAGPADVGGIPAMACSRFTPRAPA